MKPQVVVDASAMLQLVLPDGPAQRESMSELIDAILAGEVEMCVPVIFFAELAAGCNKAVGRKDLPLASARAWLTNIAGIQAHVEVDMSPSRRWLDRAHQYDTQVYDGAYVDLAQRLGAAVASTDKRMRAAVTKLGLQLVGPEPPPKAAR